MSDSLRLHGLQNTRLPCPSLSPEFAQTHVRWVSDVIQPSYPLSSPSPPAFNLSQHQGLFPVNQLVPSGGQSIGTSASVSVLPMNIQHWFPLGLTGLISLLSKRLSRVFSGTTVWKHQFFCSQPSLRFSSHPYMTTGETIALTVWTFVGKVPCLLLASISSVDFELSPSTETMYEAWTRRSYKIANSGGKFGRKTF